jgi:hypothetical protein
MDTGEWRHGQEEPERPPWASGSYGGQTGDPANLWVDDPTVAWGSTEAVSAPDSWVPQQRTGDDRDRRTDTGGHSSLLLDADGWYRPAVPLANSPGYPSATSPTSAPPATYAPAATAGFPSTDLPGRRPDSRREPRRDPYLTSRTGVDSWSTTRDPGPRPGPRDEPDQWPKETFDDPAYSPVIGFTAAWYGAPGVLYLIWLLTLSGDRQALVGRNFLAGLPWVAGAIVLSLTVAVLLRWAVQGWRALTISFAAAVIGAGVATIAHSLAF